MVRVVDWREEDLFFDRSGTKRGRDQNHSCIVVVYLLTASCLEQLLNAESITFWVKCQIEVPSYYICCVYVGLECSEDAVEEGVINILTKYIGNTFLCTVCRHVDYYISFLVCERIITSEFFLPIKIAAPLCLELRLAISLVSYFVYVSLI